ERHELVVANLEVEPVDRDHGPEPLADAGEADAGHRLTVVPAKAGTHRAGNRVAAERVAATTPPHRQHRVGGEMGPGLRRGDVGDDAHPLTAPSVRPRTR